MAEKTQKFLTYKGYPLVRCGDDIYYGNAYDPFVIWIKIVSTKDLNGTVVADRVLIHLLNNDPAVPLKDKIPKKSEKKGLADAIELAAIWLQRALAGK